MTLKCKIKEISEIQTQQDLERATANEDLSDSGFVENISDEEFQLQELGTIEEMHRGRKPAQKRKERGFYDKNSIGRKPSQYRTKTNEKSESRKASSPLKEDTKKKSAYRPKKGHEDEYDYYGEYVKYYPYYYHEDYYREWHYGEEWYDGYQAQYLNRYERMSRYGPYDEEAAYPHDYFDYHKGSKRSDPKKD